jgi:hypothetical protein
MDTRDNDGLNTPASAPPDDFTIKGAANKRKRSHVEPDTCAICLEAIKERAIATPCNHLSFDFICLVQWLQEHATCPLCKADVKEVQYDWRTPRDFKTYIVGQHHKAKAAATGQPRQRSSAARRRRDVPWGPQTASSSNVSVEEPSLTRRRQIYLDHTPSLHVGANRISQYQTFTPASFAASPALQTRARIFLRRELRVFDFLNRRPAGANREFLIEYLVAVLKSNDPKGADGHAEELVKEFLGREDARLMLHELDAWLRSPYERLEAWDAHVQYATTRERASGSNKRERR